jgi:hypothetical protein
VDMLAELSVGYLSQLLLWRIFPCLNDYVISRLQLQLQRQSNLFFHLQMLDPLPWRQCCHLQSSSWATSTTYI